MGVTIKQLAKELGISSATVSMVLNQKPGISAETRKLVLTKAQEMGYSKPAPEKHKENRYIHFVLYRQYSISLIDSPFFKQLLDSVELIARENGYQLTMSYFYKDKSLQEQLHALSNSRCNGFLVLATDMEEEIFRYFEKLPAPVVILDNRFSSDVCDMVSIDNRQAIASAFQYLTAQGHTNIGYLASTLDISNYRERRNAFTKLLRSTPGFAESSKTILKIPYTGTYQLPLLEQYLARRPKLPTAFLTDTDSIAGACIRTFQKCGYRVPEDISIIGFDNTPSYHPVNPALTTLDVNPQAFARLATERLIQRMNDPSRVEIVNIQLHAPLIIRQSVCCRSN